MSFILYIKNVSPSQHVKYYERKISEIIRDPCFFVESASLFPTSGFEITQNKPPGSDQETEVNIILKKTIYKIIRDFS